MGCINQAECWIVTVRLMVVPTNAFAGKPRSYGGLCRPQKPCITPIRRSEACPRRGQNNPRRFQCRSAMIDKSQNRTDRSLFGNLQPGAETFVARGLAPARLRSSRKPLFSVYLIHLGWRFWGCFATQREQAPSPQRGATAWGFVFKSLSAGTVRGYTTLRRCLQQCRNPLTGAVLR